MSTTNEKEKNAVKSVYIKWIFRVAVILCVASSILAVLAFRQPLETTKKIKTGFVKQIADFDYTTDRLPEGILSLSDAIFIKSQKKMSVRIKESVTSDKPVSVDGTTSIEVKLVANEVWEKAIEVYPEKVFSSTDKDNQIVEMELNIDLENLYKELDRISNEIIGARAKDYYLKIKPRIKGNAIYSNMKLPLSSDPEIVFAIEGDQVRLAGEKNYSLETPIEETKTVKQDLTVIGLKLPLSTSRYVFSFLSLLFMLVAAIALLYRIKNPEKAYTSEDAQLDKRYGVQLIPIQKPLDIVDKTILELQDFKALLRISNEKDRCILKYEDKNAGQVLYYLIDGEYIYSYTSFHKHEEPTNISHNEGGVANGI